MDNFIWVIIGLIIIAGVAVGVYRWRTGKLPKRLDPDGDGKLFK